MHFYLVSIVEAGIKYVTCNGGTNSQARQDSCHRVKLTHNDEEIIRKKKNSKLWSNLLITRDKFRTHDSYELVKKKNET